jgi:hypothetical protein
VIGPALVALAIAAGAAAPDSAEELFRTGQFGTAAAVFESRWESGRDPRDGVNAATAWRRAGRYAWARALLGRVRRETPPRGDVAAHADALAKRLTELTATVALGPGIPRTAVITVDGRIPPRVGDELVVDAGARSIRVEADGCEAAEWTGGGITPGAHVVVDLQLRCLSVPGAVHIQLLRDVGARATVDGKQHTIEVQDLELQLPAGRHELEVERSQLTFERRTFEVAPGETTRVEVPVPWRAQGAGIGLGLGAFTYPVGGGAALAAGVHATYVGRAGERALVVFDGMVGVGNALSGTTTTGTPNAGGPTTAVAFQTGVWRVWGPLWMGRVASAPVSVDFEPFTLAVWARYTSGSATNAGDVAVGSLPIVLSIDVPFGAHVDARAFPLSMAQADRPDRTRSPWKWAPVFQLSLDWTLLR